MINIPDDKYSVKKTCNEDCLYSSMVGKVKWHDGNNMKLKAGCKM